MIVEPATPDDLEAITELWVRLARDQCSHGSYVRPDPNRTTMRETLAAYQATDGLLVARVDGEIVGFASFSVEHGALELEATRGSLSNLYVEPDYRGRGIGSALLEAVEAAFEARDVEVLVLEVMAENEEARRFYRRHGYDPLRVTMERSLAGRSENDTHSKEDR
ncbi:GNAT family N-acetyltransferase [Natrialba swarupiae]|uniref:GNAT family N-acetyltransferase n=1 Tax=Natrialba swarupiae TaxID=2448032 RepID=A0A5D5AL64_9EURY|nr:GNAT family N-acetyltransferase [Natrialba swarupiae]TYT61577.1 GNAT family N-acetyltransferase [Natrialba swarupiae]